MASEIPIEVLDIFIHTCLRDDHLRRTTRLTDILCVCRRWYDVGIRLIWQDIILRKGSTMLRLSSVPECSNLAPVKSLTVTFSPFEPELLPDPMTYTLVEGNEFVDRNGNKDTRELWAGLMALQTIIPDMSNLISFSFYVRESPTMQSPIGFWLEHRQLFHLVDSLPLSIRYLELDTKSRENTKSADQDFDICKMISQRLPQIEHLRLRLNRLCANIIIASESLKTAVINMLYWDYETMTRQCGEVDFIQGDRWALNEEAGHRTLTGLIEHTTNQLPALPNIDKLTVIDSQIRKEGRYDIINVRDVMTAKTTVSPITNALIGGGSYPIVHLRYRGEDGTVKDVVGHMDNIEELLEGPAWCNTPSGSRFPVAFKDSAEGRGYRWAEYNNYRTKAEILEKENGWHVPFFGDERNVDGLLVEPFEVEGLGDIEAPVKEQHSHDDVEYDQEHYDYIAILRGNYDTEEETDEENGDDSEDNDAANEVKGDEAAEQGNRSEWRRNDRGQRPAGRTKRRLSIDFYVKTQRLRLLS